MMESIDPRDIMLEIPTIVSEGSCAGLDGWRRKNCLEKSAER